MVLETLAESSLMIYMDNKQQFVTYEIAIIYFFLEVADDLSACIGGVAANNL